MKNKSWERNCSKINMYLGGTKSTESWRLMKQLRKNQKKDIISTITMDRWETYFKTLLTENRAEFKTNNKNEEQIRVMTSPLRITVREVKEICKTLKNGKAAGPGEIPGELIKYGTEQLYRHLTTLFQMCIDGATTPRDWRTSYFSTIFKKGNRENCSNYRGL